MINNIFNNISNEFKKSDGIDLREDPMALQRLKEAGEAAKKELSTSKQTDINLPFVTADASGPKHLNLSLNKLLCLVQRYLTILKKI